jgi:hypothetical protein
MPSSRVDRLAAAIVCAALLAGCGSSTQFAPPTTQAATAGARSNTHGVSWMAKDLTGQDLLYVGNANGTVNVYSYADGTLVGVLTRFTQPQGMCTDRSGNVYIADFKANKVFEYAHGGEKPIKTFKESPFHPYACSVDTRTGDLAVANYAQNYYDQGNVRIYSPGSKQPVTYTGTTDDHFTGCAYDDHGDLFVLSYNFYYYYSGYGTPVFYYLPKRATQLLLEDVPNPHSYSGWEYTAVQGLAWDGRHWIVENDGYLDRFNINVKVTYVGATLLTATYRYQGPIALYRQTPKAKATQVVAASGTFSGKSAVDYWAYPAGGYPTQTITQYLDNAFGVAISLGATSR